VTTRFAPRAAAISLAFLVTAASTAAVTGRVPTTLAQPARGQFLVAARHMADPRFRQSVVLLLSHDESGTAGVIVNRVTPVAARRLLPDLEGLARRDDPMYFGGPVSFGEVTALVRSATPPSGSREILPGVYFTASRAAVESLLGGDVAAGDLRLLLGHAGWAPRQLEAEIARGDWYLVDADPGEIFRSDAGRLWPELVERLEPAGTQI